MRISDWSSDVCSSDLTDWSIELRTRDRQRKLISKIDAALRRIDEGEYGYCEVTGEPISLARLEARPIATMTLEAQERHERQEKVSRDAAQARPRLQATGPRPGPPPSVLMPTIYRFYRGFFRLPRFRRGSLGG